MEFQAQLKTICINQLELVCKVRIEGSINRPGASFFARLVDL
jgi:hypothetical protein